MDDLLVVKTSGVQRTRVNAPPLPFNFERHVLAGGGVEPSIMRAMIHLSFAEMFPDQQGGALFQWSTLRPHEVISYVSMYHSLNESMNDKSISQGRPFLPIEDDKIKERILMVGMMSPNEIEARYSPEAMRPSL